MAKYKDRSEWLQAVHERAAFERAIAEKPGDWNLHAVFAKWLDDQGWHAEARHQRRLAKIKKQDRKLGEPPIFGDGIRCRGEFFAECFDEWGKRLNSLHCPNTTMTAGRTDLLSQGFAAGTQRTTWYAGLIEDPSPGGDPPTAPIAGDTLASHGGWTELTVVTDYDGNRKQWSPSVASAVASNASPMAFTMNGGQSVAGALLCTVSTGTSGILWAAGNFTAGTQTLSNDQILNLSYSLTLS